jgi:hypothetical protein
MSGFGVVLTDFGSILHGFDPKISLFFAKIKVFCVLLLWSLEQKSLYKVFCGFALFSRKKEKVKMVKPEPKPPCLRAGGHLKIPHCLPMKTSENNDVAPLW